MSIAHDIFATYVRPRQVFARRMGQGAREDRAIATLMAACVLIFVSYWPKLARDAHFDDSVSLQMQMGAALLGWVFVMPLALYAIAALSHVIARLFGGRGTWFRARLALFWSLLAATPLWLLHGLVAGFVGPGPALSLVGLLALGAFVVFWGVGLNVAEGAGQTT